MHSGPKRKFLIGNFVRRTLPFGNTSADGTTFANDANATTFADAPTFADTTSFADALTFAHAPTFADAPTFTDAATFGDADPSPTADDTADSVPRSKQLCFHIFVHCDPALTYHSGSHYLPTRLCLEKAQG